MAPELELDDDDELLELLDVDELFEEELLDELELLDEEDELLAVSSPPHPTSTAADVKKRASPRIRQEKLELCMV